MVITWTYSAPANTATASGAGSTNFAGLVTADTAGGWGKFTADASGTQIICNALIVIGDATNACVFSDSDKQILFLNYTLASAGSLIDVKSSSTLSLGEVVNSGNKATKNGCSLTSLMNGGQSILYLVRARSGSTTNLYSCTFDASNIRHTLSLRGNLWNCNLVRWIELSGTNGESGGNYNIYNTVVSNSFIGLNNIVGTVNKLTCYGLSYGIAFDTTGGNNLSFSNVFVRNSVTYDINAFYLGVGKTGSLVNPDFDRYHILWAASNGVLYRQYEFDLTVRDSAGNPLEDATCTIDDAAATEIFNVDTDANGAITTQTVSRGYYNQANGDTLQDYGPHTLTITKAGYATYTAKVIFDMKLNLRIVLTSDAEAALYPALTGNASATDVLEGKTFYKDDAATQLTGTATFTVTTQMSTTETRVIYKKDPLRLPLMLATESLLIQNQRLKHKLRTQ
jgi:hypothetical protein